MTSSARTKTPLDRDKLSMVPRHQAADAAFLALDAIQEEQPEVMMMGAGVLFAALTQRTGLDPYALYQMGQKVLTDEDFHRKTNASLQSLRDFAGLRIMGQEVSIS